MNSQLKPKTYGVHPKLYAKEDNLKSNSGTVVLFAVLLMALFLSIVLTLSAIFIPKIRVAGDIKKSVAAAYAAESAVEWCLYVNRIGSTALPVMSNGAAYTNGKTGVPFVAGDCAASPIKAIGTYQGVTRSFEISF